MWFEKRKIKNIAIILLLALATLYLPINTADANNDIVQQTNLTELNKDFTSTFSLTQINENKITTEKSNDNLILFDDCSNMDGWEQNYQNEMGEFVSNGSSIYNNWHGGHLNYFYPVDEEEYNKDPENYSGENIYIPDNASVEAKKKLPILVSGDFEAAAEINFTPEPLIIEEVEDQPPEEPKLYRAQQTWHKFSFGLSENSYKPDYSINITHKIISTKFLEDGCSVDPSVFIKVTELSIETQNQELFKCQWNTNSSLREFKIKRINNNLLFIVNNKTIYQLDNATSCLEYLTLSEFARCIDAYDYTPTTTYINQISVGPPDTSITGNNAVEYCRAYNPAERAWSLALEPIDTGTGAHIIQKQLINLNGAVPLAFGLDYNSLLLNEGPIGKGWAHNYETCIEPQADGKIMLKWSANRNNTFTLSENSTYISSDQACQSDKLVKKDDGSYELTRKDQSIYRFDSAGRLIQQLNTQKKLLQMGYDQNNRLNSITEPLSGRFINLAYNDENLLTVLNDSLNRQFAFSYDTNHNLVNITNPDGRSTAFTYDAESTILSETDEEGNLVFQNKYDNKKRIISQKDGLNQVSSLDYDEISQPGEIITTITDRTGKARVYTHNNKYELIQVTDQLGKMMSMSYDADGNRSTITDAAGNTTHMTYDDRNNLLSVADPSGNSTNMSYDENNNLITITNANGKSITLSYDANNNLISSTDALNNQTKYNYDQDGLVISQTSPEGGITEYSYQNGQVKAIKDPAGVVISYAYDNAGRLIAITNMQGAASSITYDNENRITSITDPLDHDVSFTYDGRGNMLTKTDANGNMTIHDYDFNQNLIKVTDALGNITSYEYDGEDRLTKIIDARGNPTTITYDARGRQIAITDPLGNVRKMEYDNVNNIISYTNPMNQKTTTLTYDALHNPLSITDALGNASTMQYDKLSRLVSSANPLNQIYQFTYDDANQLTQSTDPMNGIARQEFNKDGNRTALIDPLNNRMNLIYDVAGRLSRVNTATGAKEFVYNQLGYISSITNGRGQTSHYAYDDAGRLISRTDPGGTVTFSYDNNGNVLTVSDSSGTITRQYDALNRVSRYTDIRGNTIQYGYNENGNLTSLTYPDGKVVNYQYDAANQLIKVSDWAGRVTLYSYDPNGRLLETRRADGSVEYRIYDAAGRIIQLKDSDSSGKLINNYDYSYNAAAHLTGEQSSVEAQSFTVNNASMNYSSDNRLSTFNNQAVTCDADGNMINGPLNGQMQNYTYDSRNRLQSAGNTTYSYDAENNRIGLTQAEAETTYVINPNNGLSQVLISTDPNGQKTYYIYGMGLIGQEDANGYRSYHYDLRGSSVALTDQNGAITDTFQYGPYGELVNSSGSSTTPFRYCGQYGVMTDANGLYYMRARYYSPEIKRFINQDVIIGSLADTQSLNRYAYVLNNPVFYVDPEGDIPVLVVTMVAGALLGAGISAVTTGIMEYHEKGSLSEIDWRKVGVSAAAGAVSGAISGSGAGLIASIGGNAAIAGATYVTNQWLEGEEISSTELLATTVAGGAAGWIGGKGVYPLVDDYFQAINIPRYLNLQSGVEYNQMELMAVIPKIAISNISRTFAGSFLNSLPNTIVNSLDKNRCN